jgi:hypothetical protein
LCPEPPTVVRPATISGASVATSKAISSLKLMSFCTACGGSWLLHTTVLQQCNSQPTNSAAAAQCFQRCRCYLASEVLLPTVHTVFISTPNQVKKCSQHILSEKNGCLCAIHIDPCCTSMLSSLCCSNLPSCSHCRLHNATHAS